MLFTNKEEIVYGILLVLIYTVILDKVLLMVSTRTKVEIMTEKYEELYAPAMAALTEHSNGKA